MTTKNKNNFIPISVKGKKKVLAPLNIINNKSINSSSTKESIKNNESQKDLFISMEKIEIDCENDKKEDAIFLAKLSESEKFFFEVKAKDIYDFLKSIHLIRYIESFIQDGFETKEDLMEIQEDYFQENKNFNKNQQKRILAKAKEYLDEFIKNNKSINLSNSMDKIEDEQNIKILKNEKSSLVETGVGGDVGGGSSGENFKNLNIYNRCWSCFNKIKNDGIEIKYKESIITKTLRFCSEKCKKKFEGLIYINCDNCQIKYDKSKGDFIHNNYHFHSESCRDEFLNKNININKIDNDNNDNIKIIDLPNIINETDENNIYDPMNDF